MIRTLILVLIAWPLPLAGQTVERLMERASTRYGAMEGLCAEFHQTLEVPLLGQQVDSRGTLCQMDPSFFRMVFADPAGDLIVADGEFLWIYTPSSHPGQAIRTNMGDALQTVDFYGEFLHEPQVKYRMEDLGTQQADGRILRGVRLLPRAASPYVSADVWLDADEALVYRVRIEQENSSVRTVALSNLQVDPAMSAADFTFSPPAGVTVVTR